MKDDVLFLLITLKNESAVSYELSAPRFAVESKRRTKRGLQYIERTYGYNVHRTWEDIHWEYYWHASCQGTVPQALIAFLTSSSNFEDAIRRAVSLGGDSDTLACITGGIAEAYYKEIPKTIADRVVRPFPRIFHKILDAVREETVYGKNCKIVE